MALKTSCHSARARFLAELGMTDNELRKMIKLYNTLSREKEILPPDQKKIRLFVCGPTVYDYLHIGNARTYIFFDFFAKYLRSQGYDTFYLQNITDIDDKIIKRAAETKTEPHKLAKEFTQAYFEDMAALGVNAVTKYAPATDFIMQIVAQVERLIEKGYAYKIDNDGWYFDISKDKDYGKLSGRTVEQAEDGVSRIDEAVGKKNKGDFCLWKFSKPNEPKWPSRLGEGRPGWHIEDTAISEYYFGPQYDIHGGGVDLKFPHHEAEIAQQESASGLTPFVQTWVHVGALTVDGKKMSKSVGNFITIREFLSKYPAPVLRYFFFGTHYRSPANFTWESLEAARNGLESLYSQIHELSYRLHGLHADPQGIPGQSSPYESLFQKALNDDLNAPQALALTRTLLKVETIPIQERLDLIKKFDSVLGLNLAKAIKLEPSEIKIPAEIHRLANQREKYRVNQQFKQSDDLRKEINDLGYEVEDTPTGPVLRPRS